MLTARAVQGNPRIDHRAIDFVDPAPHRRDDLVDDVHQVRFILEDNVGLLDDSAPLHVHRFIAC